MPEFSRYRPSFSDLATEFIVSLPKRRQRRIMDRAYELARDPFLDSDYRILDSDGRTIDHLLLDGVVFFILGRSSSKAGHDH